MWEGKIQSSKIGGQYWFKKSLLDSWLGKKPEVKMSVVGITFFLKGGLK
jgi:hypothetical protein